MEARGRRLQGWFQGRTLDGTTTARLGQASGSGSRPRSRSLSTKAPRLPAYYASVLFEGWPRNYSFNMASKPLPTRFVVSSKGEMDHPEAFDATLRAKKSHTLAIDFPLDGKLIVHVPEIEIKGEPVLEVWINGRQALRQPLQADDPRRPWVCWKAYPVATKAGHHEIHVANTGTGVIYTAYELANYLRREGSDLEVLGLQADDYLILWVRNPQYVWLNDREGRKPTRQEPGVLTLSGVTDGKYSVQWRETTTDESLGEAEATGSGGRLVLRTPAITRSAAAKLVFKK